MRIYQQSPQDQAAACRVVLNAIGLGLFLFVLVSALYIVDDLFTHKGESHEQAVQVHQEGPL